MLKMWIFAALAFTVIEIHPFEALAFGHGPVAMTEKTRDELVERRRTVREWATRCNNGQFSASEENCDQGDLTLFAGISCLAGEKSLCNDVILSQGENGRWWRGPSRIDQDEIDSFSRDQSMGVLAYLIASKDRTRARAWINWIQSNFGVLCTRSSDNRCFIMPGNWALFGRVWENLSLEPVGPMSTWKGYGEIILYFEAITSPLDFPLHLVAVHLWLLRQMGYTHPLLSLIADVIYQRDPNNLFFQYLSEGPSEDLAQNTLKLCPLEPFGKRTDWAWQRPSRNQPWKNSNGHDCVFLINLLLAN